MTGFRPTEAHDGSGAHHLARDARTQHPRRFSTLPVRH
jgi:hypothetical protein